MINKRRQCCCAILAVLSCLVVLASSDATTKSTGTVDDLQVVFSEPSVSVMKPPTRYQYANDVKQCPTGESKMMLTLLLRGMRWSRISEKKREKAIKKLSRFFLIPRQFITVDDTHTPEIVEMVKNSINKSNNILNPKETVGRVEFMIGCGDKVFENGKSIAHQIDEQIRTGVLEELTSGLTFDYWNIWTKHVKSRVQRTKRQVDGSGDNAGAEEDEDYEYETEDEDNETDNQDELPASPPKSQSKNKPKTSQNHREESSKSHQEGAEAEDEVENDNENKQQKVDDYDVSTSGRKFGEDQDERESKIIKLDVVQTQAIPLVPTEENEAITSRTIRINEDFPTPIDPIESTKLESIVNKTIVNDNNVFDVPLEAERDEDQLLAEVIHVTEQAQTEPTIMDFEERLTTQQPTVEGTNEEEVLTTEKVVTITTTLSATTLATEEVSEQFSHSNAITSPPEIDSDDNDDALDLAETFLPLPNESSNNEDINNEELEQLSIETTTIIPSTASSTVRLIVDAIESTPAATLEDDDKLSESVDESSTAASAATTTTSSSISSTTQEQLNEFEIETSSHTQSMTSTFSPPPIDSDLDSLTTTEIPSTSSTTTTVVSNVVESITIAEDLDKATTTSEKPRKTTQGEKAREESNYDDEYDDNDVDDNKSTRSSSSTQATPRSPARESSGSDYDNASKETASSTARSTEAANLENNTPDSDGDYEDSFDDNNIPYVTKRIPKAVAAAGKPFAIRIENDVFFDTDGDELTLMLLDKDGNEIPASSWIQYDTKKREVYGLPLESDVSRHDYKIKAADGKGGIVEESFEITVQQYRGARSINNEIGIKVKLEKPFSPLVDWQIRLVRGIVEAIDDTSLDSIIVNEVTPHPRDKDAYTFIFTNDSLPKNHCPKDELEKLMTRLTKGALNIALEREIFVKDVSAKLVGVCKEKTDKPTAPSGNAANFPPTIRNSIDRIEATVGQLLVFPVPQDTFYDPEDQHDLKLTLLKENRAPIEASNWLQFDARNKEFFGVPTMREINNQGYILVAEDKEGLTVQDALVVDINDEYYKKDLSVNFEFNLDISSHHFNHAAMKRKFIESVAKIFNDSHTGNVVIGSLKEKYDKHTSVFVHNATLKDQNGRCPDHIIEELRNKVLRSDGNVHDRVKEILGSDFPIIKINVSPMGNCANSGYHHPDEITPTTEANPAYINNDLLVTYLLPTGIILVMLLIALIIACLLYKRRNTGKMELGDEEERKSFRSKGIPVIFQDELEEKPEIATKSPIILKDEKPPLLPHYNGLNNHDDEENVDQYIPPQPLLMGNRESRGKSPVTPSYRKPPPYVSP